MSRGLSYYTVKGKWLRQKLGINGYCAVSLAKNGVVCRMHIHRLVAEAWVPKQDAAKTLHVNHKNGEKLDNRADNLEWVTPSENTRHAYEIGKKKATRKLNDDQRAEVLRRITSGDRIRQIAKDFDMCPSQIYAIRRGQIYKRPIKQPDNITGV